MLLPMAVWRKPKKPVLVQGSQYASDDWRRYCKANNPKRLQAGLQAHVIDSAWRQ